MEFSTTKEDVIPIRVPNIGGDLKVKLTNNPSLQELDSFSINKFVSVLEEDLTDAIKLLATQQLIKEIENFINESLAYLNISEVHKEAYRSSFLVMEEKNNILVIFQPMEWLIGAMENGAAPYSIKEALLTSSGAKMSKKGYLYRVIPMTNKERVKGLGGSFDIGSVEFDQQMIKDTLSRAKYKYKLLEENYKDGFYHRRESIRDLNRQGKPRKIAERIRTYRTRQEFQKRVQPRVTEFTTFKTVSENPDSINNNWTHPGFVGYHIFENAYNYGRTRLTRIIKTYKDRILREF